MSLDTVELILAIEEEFDLRIPGDKAAQMTTAGKVFDYVLSQITEAKSENFNQEEIWEKVKRIVIEQVGVRPKEVTKSASFVEDLGLD